MDPNAETDAKDEELPGSLPTLQEAISDIVTLTGSADPSAPEALTAGPDAPEAVKERVAEINAAAPGSGLQDQANFLPAKQVMIVFFGLSVALVCSFLEQTMMATALPSISASLNSGSNASWIITSYLLVSTAITPLSSRFSDIFGRKVVLMFCLGEFWLASLACAVAQTTMQMIVFRSLAGIGGGSLINLALIIISDVVSLRDRGKYQGIFEIVIGISAGIGPLIGGGLAETNWRFIFWLCVILCTFAMIIEWKLLPLRKVTGDIKTKVLQIDFVGCALVLAASILVLLGLNWGSVRYPWVSAPVLSTMLVGGVLFVALGVYEALDRFKPKIPIIPVSIFEYRTVIGVMIMTLCNGAMQYSLMFYLPQWFQVVRGVPALRSGVLILPYLTLIAPTIFTCAQITARYGKYRPQIYAGSTTLAVATGLLTTLTPDSSTARVIGFEVLTGLGAGGVFQTSLQAAQAAVPRQDVAVVTGFRNFIRLLSGTIFLAIGSCVINQSITRIGLPSALLQQILNDPPSIHTLSGIDDATRQNIINAYQEGFRTVFHIMSGLAALSSLSAFLLIQHHTLNRQEDIELKAAGKKFMQDRKEKKQRRRGATLDKDVEKA